MSNKKITVTILMAGYRSKVDLLRDALESIKIQTYQDFEIVFVDDGCGQAALECLNQYQNDLNIKVLHNTENMGLPKSLNRGLSIAQGEYIARFDDDDIMLPDRLEKQIHFLEQHQKYAGCWSEFDFIDSQGNVIGKSNAFRTNYRKQFVSKGNCCCHSSLFLRKSVMTEVGGYNEKYLYAQDLDLYLAILRKYDMYCLKDCLVQFRKNTTRNPIDKQVLSFVFSFSSALRYVYENRTLKNKIYLMLRILVMIKFCFIDIFKIDSHES